MTPTSIFAFCIAFAALCPASTAFGQTREAFGPVLPMVFDGQGGRHYCLYGYYGPFDPSIAPSSDYSTLVCPHENSQALSIRSAHEGRRVSSAKVRAQASAAK
jgi:hypothetical protein